MASHEVDLAPNDKINSLISIAQMMKDVVVEKIRTKDKISVKFTVCR